MKKLFGDDLDAAIAAKATDSAAASCQGALMKAIDKCWAARMRAYTDCVPGTFALPTPGAAEMGACRTSDPEGAVAGRLRHRHPGDARQEVRGRRPAVDLDVRLPGCECRYPQDCMQVALANAENRMISAAANLPAADTVLPFVRTPQAHTNNGPWTLPRYGEYVASAILRP